MKNPLELMMLNIRHHQVMFHAGPLHLEWVCTGRGPNRFRVVSDGRLIVETESVEEASKAFMGEEEKRK